MSNETQHTPADVRGRIIRASILPAEDEETMIAGLRAGAEAVERGELDAEDFVAIWSQYLRRLLRASSVPAPADVRELAVEIIRSLDLIARNYDSYEYGLPVMTHYDEMVDTVVAILRTPAAPADGSARGALWDEVHEIVLDAMDEAHGPDGTLENAAMYANRIFALLRTPRGEGDVKPLAWRVEYRGRTGGEWEYLNTYDLVEVAKEKVERMRRGGVRLEYRIVPLYPAALRSEAQGDAEALAAARVPTTKGGEMSEGTLQALRDRINARLQTSAISRDRASAAGREIVAQCRQSDVETLEWVLSEIDAVLAAIRSEAQGEDRWEDVVFGPITQAYNEAHAARRGEGGGE